MLRFGLFIGVDRYLHINSPLEGAAADAIGLARVFQDHLGFETEVLTHDDLGYSGASRSINAVLGQWEQRVREKPGGILVIYYAGHGTTSVAGEHLLLLPTASAKVLETRKRSGEGIWTDADLLEETRDWPGMDRLFVFDACRTSLGRTHCPEGKVGQRDLGPRRPDHGQGVALLKSCQDWEIAHELRNIDGNGTSHGLFTAALMEVLESSDRQSPIILDGEFNARLAHSMKIWAGKAHIDNQPEVTAQTPFLQGSIRLLGNQDRQEIQVRQYLAAFESQLQAGKLSNPPADCCRDTLQQLITLGHGTEAVKNLSGRVLAAEAEQDDSKLREQDGRQISVARQLGTPVAYGQYLRECRLCRYQAEADIFIRLSRAQADESTWWAESELAKTPAAYQAYLAMFPQGVHATAARQALGIIEKPEPIPEPMPELTPDPWADLDPFVPGSAAPTLELDLGPKPTPDVGPKPSTRETKRCTNHTCGRTYPMHYGVCLACGSPLK